MSNKTFKILITVLIFLALFLPVKCVYDEITEPRWTWKEICKDTEKRAKFIVDCAKAANPMSDEEGEDLVRQCDITSKHLFCEYTKEYY